MTLCKSSSEVCFTAVRSVKSENFTGLQIDERDRMAGYAFLTEKRQEENRKPTDDRQKIDARKPFASQSCIFRANYVVKSFLQRVSQKLVYWPLCVKATIFHKVGP